MATMNLDCAVGRAQVGLLARYQLSPVLQTGLRDVRYLGPSFRFTHRILLKLIFIHQPSSTFFGGKVTSTCLKTFKGSAWMAAQPHPDHPHPPVTANGPPSPASVARNAQPSAELQPNLPAETFASTQSSTIPICFEAADLPAPAWRWLLAG